MTTRWVVCWQDKLDTIRLLVIGVSAHQKLELLERLVTQLGYDSLTVFGDCFDEVGLCCEGRALRLDQRWIMGEFMHLTSVAVRLHLVHRQDGGVQGGLLCLPSVPPIDTS